MKTPSATKTWTIIITSVIVAISIAIGLLTSSMGPKEIYVSFPSSNSPDIDSYKVYYTEDSNQITHDSQFINIGKKTRFKLSILPIRKEGVFKLGIAAVDGGGSEGRIVLTSKQIIVKKVAEAYVMTIQ